MNAINNIQFDQRRKYPATGTKVTRIVQGKGLLTAKRQCLLSTQSCHEANDRNGWKAVIKFVQLTEVPMTKLPAKTLAVVALLSACTRPSPDSNALEVELVPQLIEWSRVGGEFDLAKSLPEGAYDKVCIVSEYSSLNSLEKLGRVDEYHSAFGMSVPEGSSALAVIGSNKVHAALVDGARLRFSGPFGAECVTATRAILRSNFEPHLKVQTADLFEKE